MSLSEQSNDPMGNDCFREHEEVLEKQPHGRGKLRADAEDEGRQGQEKEIRKQRAGRNKEDAPPKAVPKRVFSYLPPSKEELEAPRQLTLKSDIEIGPGIELHACWWGMVVDGIDDDPGQPGLRLRDTIADVNGTSLGELSDDDCEQRFAELFWDGAVVTVVPYVQTVGVLHTQNSVDRKSLNSDLDGFAAYWGVELRCEEISSGGTSLRIILEVPQVAVKAAKGELENLMKCYAGG